MTASIHAFPQPRNYLRAVPPDAAPAEIILFPEHRRSARSYMDAWTELTCQGALVVASIVALQLHALGVARLHPHQDGASTWKKIYREGGEPSPNEPPGAA